MHYSDRSQDELFNLVAQFQDETELPMSSGELRELSLMLQGVVAQSLKMRLRMQSIQRPLPASLHNTDSYELEQIVQQSFPGMELDDQEGNVTQKRD